jgi:hypothetical protein
MSCVSVNMLRTIISQEASQIAAELAACFMLVSRLAYSRWRRRVPSKRRLTLCAMHGFVSQKIHTVAYRPVARGDSLNNSRCCGAPAAYACAVTSHNNRRRDTGGVFCRSAPRLYDCTARVLLRDWVECSWGFTRGVLNSGQRKRNNLRC